MTDHLSTRPVATEPARLAAITLGYDYFARIWLDGPLRPEETALRAWLADLTATVPALAARCGGLVRLLDDAGEHADAESDFQNCLVVPQPGRYLPPYASAWTDGPDELWGPTTVRVAQCYSQAGLDWQLPAQNSDRPWVRAPDHLGVECAFTAELAAASVRRLAADPGPDGPADPGALAASFVTGHIRTWVPAYAAQLAGHAGSRYWQEAASILVTWLRQDSLLPSRAGQPVTKPTTSSQSAG